MVAFAKTLVATSLKGAHPGGTAAIGDVVDNNFETQIKNLYVGGDGAGITRGLAQAGACGVYIARNISEKKD